MSAYTTLRITRDRARAEVIKAVCGDLSDSFLEEFMDRALRERLYNCQIVSEGEDNDNGVLDGGFLSL